MQSYRSRIAWALALLFAAASSLSAGCGGASTRPFVAGPYALADDALFAHVTQNARSHGYQIAEEDAARGRFVVPSHTTTARGLSARFIVQCYRPGWLQVTLDGPSVRRAGDTFSMSGDLYAEYRDFSIGLMDDLEQGGAATTESTR